MYSMKPGRGPSFLGGFASIGAAIFGVIWMIGAANMGAPKPMVLFGLVFVLIALGQAVYNFYNAGAKRRLSSFDIVSEAEEPDPLNEKFGSAPRFCTACGQKNGGRLNKFCGNCGKQLA